MKKADELKMKGTFTVRVYEDDVLLKEETYNNLIVGAGRNAVAALVGGDGTLADKVINQISFGTNGAAPTLGDVAPLAGAFTQAVDGHTPDAVNYNVTFDWSLDNADNNGVTIREFGLLCHDGTLFARVNNAGIAKTSAIRLEGTWKLQF